MRFVLILSFVLLGLTVKAQSVSKETEAVLQHFAGGYTEFAVRELMNLSRVNDMSAQYYLAVCYEYGLVVEKDDGKAFELYRKTAERGLPDAMLKVAAYYTKLEYLNQNRRMEWAKRYERRGGKNVLPDLLPLFNGGLKYPANYALNPTAAPQTPNENLRIVAANAQHVQPIAPVLQEATACSSVDMNIPQGEGTNEHTFVVIIANENYRREGKVPYAHNDGEIFKAYCISTLGIPERNIKHISDASLNDLRYNLNWLKQVMDAYNGEAKAIFYYAGHGIPDEAERTAYLLPVDGYASDVTTGYRVDELYTTLGGLPSKSVTVFLDACFSGSQRGEEMLMAARAVAIKAKKSTPVGHMVVFSAAQGDETAYPYEEQRHGMFTYYLLKKLQETKGDVTLGELGDYVTSEVKKQSIVLNGKMQTPTVIPSLQASDNWRQWKLR